MPPRMPACARAAPTQKVIAQVVRPEMPRVAAVTPVLMAEPEMVCQFDTEGA